MTPEEAEVIEAVLYAMKEGCFFPLRKPKPGAGIRRWVKWGAIQNLHNAVANYTRREQAAGSNQCRAGANRSITKST
jgi:hypothetical protein